MKGYWIICVKSYEIDGEIISIGHMNYHTSIRCVVNSAWRKATEKEIEMKRWHKGIWYCHSEYLNQKS